MSGEFDNITGEHTVSISDTVIRPWDLIASAPGLPGGYKEEEVTICDANGSGYARTRTMLCRASLGNTIISISNCSIGGGDPCEEESYNDWTEIVHCDPSDDTEYITKIGGHASLANAYNLRIATSVSIYCQVSGDSLMLRHFYRDLNITPCGKIHSISEEYFSVFEDLEVQRPTALSISASGLLADCDYFTQIDNCSLYTPPGPPPFTYCSDCEPSSDVLGHSGDYGNSSGDPPVDVSVELVYPGSGSPPVGGGAYDYGYFEWHDNNSANQCRYLSDGIGSSMNGEPNDASANIYYDNVTDLWMFEESGDMYEMSEFYGSMWTSLTGCDQGPLTVSSGPNGGPTGYVDYAYAPYDIVYVT
jgi:hypothetical protein